MKYRVRGSQTIEESVVFEFEADTIEEVQDMDPDEFADEDFSFDEVSSREIESVELIDPAKGIGSRL